MEFRGLKESTKIHILKQNFKFLTFPVRAWAIQLTFLHYIFSTYLDSANELSTVN
jgi:hypothetical protein